VPAAGAQYVPALRHGPVGILLPLALHKLRRQVDEYGLEGLLIVHDLEPDIRVAHGLALGHGRPEHLTATGHDLGDGLPFQEGNRARLAHFMGNGVQEGEKLADGEPLVVVQGAVVLDGQEPGLIAMLVHHLDVNPVALAEPAQHGNGLGADDVGHAFYHGCLLLFSI